MSGVILLPNRRPGALAIAPSSGGYVDHGSGADLDDLGAGSFSVWAWVYRTANGGNQHIITKDGSFPSGWALVADNGVGEGEARFIVWRSTATDFISASGEIPLNTWTFVCAAYTKDPASGNEVAIYIGGINTPASEPSYTTAQDGVGAINADAAYNLYVGNLQRATTLPFLGRVALPGVAKRRLTLKEAREIQYRTLARDAVPDTLLLPDYQGLGEQEDLSGNGHHGSTTNVSIAEGPPLYRPQGRRIFVPAAASSPLLSRMMGEGLYAGMAA